MCTSKNEMYSSILEGISFETRRIINDIESKGITINIIHVTGGYSKYEDLLKVKSGVLNRELYVMENYDSGLIGLAIICLYYADKKKDLNRIYRKSKNNKKLIDVPDIYLEDKYHSYLKVLKICDFYGEETNYE